MTEATTLNIHRRQVQRQSESQSQSTMAIFKRSRRSIRTDSKPTASKAIPLPHYCCLVLMVFHLTTQSRPCLAFSTLFTASSTPTTRISSGAAKKQYLLSMSANKVTKSKKSKKVKNKEEDRRRWYSWMSSGSLSKTRHADEVRMREAEELGGVPRSDRYSSW